jgi:hypothetical protein
LEDVIVVIAGTVIFVAVTVALIGDIPTSGLETSEGKFTAAAAVLATLAVAFYTIRAKVRSENRQKWIDEVRQKLAVVINYAGHKNAVQETAAGCQRFESKMSPHLYPDANLARLTLELLLNPSEKDHRTLSRLLKNGTGRKLPSFRSFLSEAV